MAMNRLALFTSASLLLLAGCARTPPPAPLPQPEPVIPTRPAAPGTNLIGLTAGELVQRFGSPALQVREGAGLKLQFRRAGCVLDAYLYAPAAGAAERVTHVDSRLPSGADIAPATCIAAPAR